jgi:hypothetical protein
MFIKQDTLFWMSNSYLVFNIKKTRQCCGSGMFIPDPDFYPSLIPDPKTATKERGEKNLFRIPESKRHRIPDPQH